MPSTWYNCQQLWAWILAYSKWAPQLAGEMSRNATWCNVWSCVMFFSLIRSNFTCPGCKYQCYVSVKQLQKGSGSSEMGNSINWLHDPKCQVYSVSSPNIVCSSTQSFAKDLRQFWSNNPKLIKRYVKVYLSGDHFSSLCCLQTFLSIHNRSNLIVALTDCKTGPYVHLVQIIFDTALLPGLSLHKRRGTPQILLVHKHKQLSSRTY